MAVTNYYLNIFLKNTYKNLGQIETVKNNTIITGMLDLTAFTLTQTKTSVINNQFNPRTIIFTGITKSRLNEVKTYNTNLPYKVNVNGVTKVTPEFIEYDINGIEYKTFLSNSLTIYKVIKQTDEFQQEIMVSNNNSVFVDIKKTLNALIIERSNVSVYNYFNKINNCDELDDLLDIF